MTQCPEGDGGEPRLLVVRNDKIGDFMLAWPALACLKAAASAPRVSVLVPAYTAPLARQCPWIDEVLIDPGNASGRAGCRTLLQRLREARFDALLTLFSTPRIGWLGWRAGIPLRLAPATQWAQLFYNRRIVQRRSRSEKPEYVYNLELAEALLVELGLAVPPRPEPPYWPLPEGTRAVQRERITDELGLDGSRRWLFLHPGSGGSAVNLSLERYASLVLNIQARLAGASARAPAWVLTAGPGEEAAADSLRERLAGEGITAVLLPPRHGLDDFALSLSACDLLIAGSTGPLHIAGCLDRPTAGFYPSRRSATPLRWRTCNAEAHRLAFCPPPGAGEHNMDSIDLEAAASRIADLLRHLPSHETIS
ncbi:MULTISPECIES: glycosyltransferase family 9 protein [Halomonas]|nr:glycosyltransferase family 9 protein [Halomonas ventosae]